MRVLRGLLSLFLSVFQFKFFTFWKHFIMITSFKMDTENETQLVSSSLKDDLKCVEDCEENRKCWGTFLDLFFLFETQSHPSLEMNKCTAICKDCGLEISAGFRYVLSVLDNHLFLHHRDIYLADRKKRLDKLKERRNEGNSCGKKCSGNKW